MQTSRASWLGEGAFGLMVHWLAPGPPPQGGPRITDLNEAVNAFDLDRFLRDFARTGADWLIFATCGTHCSNSHEPQYTFRKPRLTCADLNT